MYLSWGAPWLFPGKDGTEPQYLKISLSHDSPRGMRASSDNNSPDSEWMGWEEGVRFKLAAQSQICLVQVFCWISAVGRGKALPAPAGNGNAFSLVCSRQGAAKERKRKEKKKKRGIMKQWEKKKKQDWKALLDWVRGKGKGGACAANDDTAR